MYLGYNISIANLKYMLGSGCGLWRVMMMVTVMAVQFMEICINEVKKNVRVHKECMYAIGNGKWGNRQAK